MLVRQGHDVVGMTMQLWNQRRLPELVPRDGGPPAAAARSTMSTMRAAWPSRSASRITWSISSAQFEEQVVKPFVDEYLAGRTPIPVHALQQLHQVRSLPGNGRCRGRAADRHRPLCAHALSTRLPAATSCCARVDASKDQTYFLFGLTQPQLARTLFPLGETDQARGARAGPRHGSGRGRQGR